MLEELKQLKTWLVHKNKQPYSVLTGMPTGVDDKHSREWVTYDEARAYLDKNKKESKESEPTMVGAGSADLATNIANSAASSADSADSADNVLSDIGVFNGLGFVIPKGYFFLDIDHNDATSPLAKEIMALLPTYAEISQSGTGVHLYGKCDFTRLPTHVINSNNGKIPRTKLASRYYVKNAIAGLEFYVGDLTERFSTFTGLAISKADDAVDCTQELLTFLDRYMLRKRGNQATSNAGNNATGSVASDNDLSWNSEAAEVDNWNWGGNKASDFNSKSAYDGNVDWPDDSDQEEPSNNVIELSVWNLIPNEERYITLEKADIPTVIADLQKQANAEKFKALYEGGIIDPGKSHSEADASLCSMIAFRVGPNSPEIIDAIFRKSALYRDKWDREDYAERTIALAIEACQGNFHPVLKRQPPFVLSNGKGKYSVEANRLAEYVRNHLHFLIVREEEQENALIFIYRDGCYRRSSNATFETTIQSFITAYDKYLVRNNVIQETIKVLLRSEIILSNEALNTNENYINVKNGLLNLQTLELHPHTPKLYSTIQIPVVWTGQETPTPMFDKYMGDLCKDRPDVYRFLLEFIGACCSNVPGHSFKKALFLYGAGDTGKSQLRTLVERLLGSKNSVALSLGQLEARFGTSYIYGKRLAGSGDMEFMSIPELKIFKRVTGGDTIFAESKGKDGFFFTYKGFLWFAMNELPKFSGDEGDWVFERMILVHCTNVIPKEKRIERMQNLMFKERDGIFYKAVMAFRDVMKAGNKFKLPDDAQELITQYRALNNTAVDFFQTMMEPRKGVPLRDDLSTVTNIYDVYCIWYSKQGYADRYKKTKDDFFRSIAGFVGETYEDLKRETHKGTSLKNYVLKPEALKLKFGGEPLVPANSSEGAAEGAETQS